MNNKKSNNDKKEKKVNTLNLYKSHLKKCYELTNDKFYKRQLNRIRLTVNLFKIGINTLLVVFIVRASTSSNSMDNWIKTLYRNVSYNIDKYGVQKLDEISIPTLNGELVDYILYTVVITLSIIFLQVIYLYAFYFKNTEFLKFIKFYNKESQNFIKGREEDDEKVKLYFYNSPGGVLLTKADNSLSEILNNKKFWEKLRVVPGEITTSKDGNYIYVEKGFSLPDRIIY